MCMWPVGHIWVVCASVVDSDGALLAYMTSSSQRHVSFKDFQFVVPHPCQLSSTIFA